MSSRERCPNQSTPSMKEDLLFGSFMSLNSFIGNFQLQLFGPISAGYVSQGILSPLRVPLFKTLGDSQLINAIT